MTLKQQEGYEWMRGAIQCVAVYFVYGLLLLLSFNLARNLIGWDVDDSDTSAWQRSGLRIHTDAATGVQYLSDGAGGLVKRETL